MNRRGGEAQIQAPATLKAEAREMQSKYKQLILVWQKSQYWT